MEPRDRHRGLPLIFGPRDAASWNAPVRLERDILTRK